MHGRARLGGDARHAVAARLEARRAEIEEATLTRVRAVSGPPRAVGPQYAEGLQAAVGAAIDFGIRAVSCGDGAAAEIPAALLVQARLAARHGVGLGTVLRRYSAGYTILGRFLAEEAEQEGIVRGGLAQLLEVQATLFDRIVDAVADEYGRERVRPASVERRRVELVKQLLDGAFVDASALAYDFEARHMAVVARGTDAGKAIDAIAHALDGHRLTVFPGEGTIWAWIAHKDHIGLDLLERRPPPIGRACLAVGEIGEGIAGWRRTHQQAISAFVIATRRPGALVRYRDVAMLAAIAQDDLLACSLRKLYLEPLATGRDDGAALRRTLRAYIDTERNVSSTAALLGVSRKTVSNRLRAIEARIGSPIDRSLTAIDVALQFADLAPEHAQVGQPT